MIHTHTEKYLLYIGVCVALLPVLLLRDFTPSNELRYLSIADEALRNHTLFAFTNHGAPYADKPPLYLWAVMAGKWLLGAHRMWFLTLFSLLPTLAIVQVLDRWTRAEIDEKNRSVARIMLLTCGLFIGLAVTLRMDMLMCLFIVLALHTFWQLRSGEGYTGRSRWLFPIYLFLALFTKGPLGILIPLCSTVVFLLSKREIRQFFRYWGGRTWAVLLAGCALWFGAVYAEGGSEYLNNLLFHQTIDRAVNSFHHEGPFYYYLISIWYSVAPWSLLMLGVLVASVRRKATASDLQRFFLVVPATTFVLLSCISAKLQVYLLPAFPFLPYATMMFLPRLRENAWLRATVAFPAVVFAVALPALAVATQAPGLQYLNSGLLYAGAALLTASGLYALYLLYMRKQEMRISGAIRALGIGLLCAVFTGGWAMPRLNEETGYGPLCETATEVARQQGVSDFRTWRIKRAENMDVYLHHPVQILPAEETPVPDAAHPVVLMLRQRDLDQFPGRQATLIGPYAVIIY